MSEPSTRTVHVPSILAGDPHTPEGREQQARWERIQALVADDRAHIEALLTPEGIAQVDAAIARAENTILFGECE